MKKTVKTLTLILAFILLLSSLSLSVFAAEVDYQKEIENFVQSPNNSFELKVGESDEPLAAIWVKNGGSAYSENENVVTVDEKGKVTAVGVGSAHVVLAGSTGMADVYLYTVTEKEENSPIGGGTIIPSVPDNTTAKPTESSSVATSTKKKTKNTKNAVGNMRKERL